VKSDGGEDVDEDEGKFVDLVEILGVAHFAEVSAPHN